MVMSQHMFITFDGYHAGLTNLCPWSENKTFVDPWHGHMSHLATEGLKASEDPWDPPTLAETGTALAVSWQSPKNHQTFDDETMINYMSKSWINC